MFPFVVMAKGMPNAMPRAIAVDETCLEGESCLLATGAVPEYGARRRGGGVSVAWNRI
jgi:hypothetical protein